MSHNISYTYFFEIYVSINIANYIVNIININVGKLHDMVCGCNNSLSM